MINIYRFSEGKRIKADSSAFNQVFITPAADGRYFSGLQLDVQMFSAKHISDLKSTSQSSHTHVLLTAAGGNHVLFSSCTAVMW